MSFSVTLGTGFNLKERVFITLTWLAKATVQVREIQLNIACFITICNEWENAVQIDAPSHFVYHLITKYKRQDRQGDQKQN